MRVLLTCLLCVLVSHAQAQSLGRLFFTPAERARLDLGPTGADTTAAAAATPPVINGVVRRGDGRSTVWVDGNAQHGSIRQLGDVAPRVAPTDAQEGERIQIRVHRP